MSQYINYPSSDPADYTLWQLIKSDYLRYLGNAPVSAKKLISTIAIDVLTGRDNCRLFGLYLRLSSRKNPFYHFAKIKKFFMRRRYGLQIPSRTKIGPGLYIGHGIGIIINGNTVIGQNCNLSQFLTIGSNKGTPATIGDRVYIGPSVCIIEDVTIGSDATIGAGTIVVHDVPAGTTSVGNPNRILPKNNPINGD